MVRQGREKHAGKLDGIYVSLLSSGGGFEQKKKGKKEKRKRGGGVCVNSLVRAELVVDLIEHVHLADERGRQLGEHVVRNDDMGESALRTLAEQVLGPAFGVYPLVDLASLCGARNNAETKQNPKKHTYMPHTKTTKREQNARTSRERKEERGKRNERKETQRAAKDGIILRVSLQVVINYYFSPPPFPPAEA